MQIFTYLRMNGDKGKICTVIKFQLERYGEREVMVEGTVSV